MSQACHFTRHAQLAQHSSEEMLASWDRMAARFGNCTSAEWKKWQQATGITYSPEALLACDELRSMLVPARQWMHDYMHALLSNGLLSYATFFLMQELDCWSTFAGYATFWNLPKQFASAPISSLFESKRLAKHKKSEKLNCTASELLSALPVLVHFLKKVHTAALQAPSTQAFLAMCALLEVLHAGYSGKVTGHMVFVLVEDALEKWKTAGWPFRKKNHWLLHFHQSFEDHGHLIGCFTMERKHKMINRKTSLLQNTTSFESSAMEEIVNGELQALAETDNLDAGIKLLQPKNAGAKDMQLSSMVWPAPWASVLAASSARCQDGTVAAGDVALFCHAGHKWACGKVRKHLQCGVQCRTVLELFALLEDHGSYAVWTHGPAEVAVDLENVFTSVTYAQDGAKFTTLIPWRWR